MNYILSETKYGNFLIDNSENVQKTIGKGIFWDAFMLDFYNRFLTAESVFLDIGGFIGSHSVYAAPKCKAVHIFEPQKELCWQIGANLLLNELRNVEIHNVALFSKQTKLGRLDTNQPHLSPSTVLKEDANGDIESKTLDSFDFDKVGVIKIDAQGCDYDILLGGINTLKKFRPVVAFEVEIYGCHTIRSFDDVCDFFESLNYDCYSFAKDKAKTNLMAVPRE